MEVLPENVIDEILRRLPTKIAARTSVLSRSWLRRWRSASDLNLTEFPSSVVSLVLSRHVGPIRLFKARCDDDDDALRCLSSLSLIASSSLQSLDLSDFSRRPICPRSIAADFPRLSHLRLSYCALSSDSFHFSALRSLQLVNVKFLTAAAAANALRQLSHLIPSCPLLEDLTLIIYEGYLCCDLASCHLPRLSNLHISYCDLEISPFFELTSLRTLHLDSGGLSGELSLLFAGCPALESLTLMHVVLARGQLVNIAAPNLRQLRFIEVANFKGFAGLRAPALEVAALDCQAEHCGGGAAGSCNMIMLFGEMAHIKKLELGHHVLKLVHSDTIPERLYVTFNQLRSLSLEVDFGDLNELLVTLCLLRSSPNLQNLKFKGCFYHNSREFGGADAFWEAQQYTDVFDRLETLKMDDVAGVKAELDFIRFVLARAKALRRMIIRTHRFITSKDLVKKKLLELPMVSDQAEVRFE